MFSYTNSISRSNMHSDHSISTDDDSATRISSVSTTSNYERNRLSGEVSPCNMSPWNQTSTFSKPSSSWSKSSDDNNYASPNTLIGSLVREEGHIYSLAAIGELLYTGSDSKNIRVWKNLKEFSAFKSASGLVKAIVISGEKIFTGHQDGKIRVWKVSVKNPSLHKRAGTLPSLKDLIRSTFKGHRSLKIKHADAISCLSLSEDQSLLYSGSWDKTLKVWRVSDSKCIESINAHDDAVNSVVSGFNGLVFTGSADGSVKVWRREVQSKTIKHPFVQDLLKQECAVTALTINPKASIVYCGSSDGLLNFWCGENQGQLSHGGTLKGHKLAVLCLASAGNLVFSGSADKTICVWRKDSGGHHTCLSVLTGHTGPVKCLAVEDDQESIKSEQRWIVYSGSLDKSVKVWNVSEQLPDIPQMGHFEHEPNGYDTSLPPSQMFPN